MTTLVSLHLRLIFCLLFMAPHLIQCWGQLGHELVVMIAEKYLSPHSVSAISHLLHDETLAHASMWADEIAHNPALPYQYTVPFHYVQSGIDDASPRVPGTNPGKTCSYLAHRDCPGGKCIIGALTRYIRLLMDCKLPVAQRSQFLKFVIHFTADIAQPFHTVRRDRGGTRIRVKSWAGKGGTNLHAIWDISLLEKHIASSYHSKEHFIAQVDTMFSKPDGKFVREYPEWTSCFQNSPSSASSSSSASSLSEIFKCPYLWARESMNVACQQAYSLFDEIKANWTQPGRIDLRDEYYEKMRWVAEKIIVRAGVRLGKVLNVALGQCPVPPTIAVKDYKKAVVTAVVVAAAPKRKT